ncbi:ADP-ribosylglycohydrolase family protein [Pseudomonas aeruginosa]|uniref:ADP-ribosylglycohydrolase family protein n=3 Tax=Pseudomonas aeruginosa TaxID=287 RepID=UPI0004466293|nr:ADP-ribosylglycohydrolase family protein [Pseudomonas aeruginosa]AWF58860.1 cyclin-dependent kinase inhibitor 3 family protein [Pseudomonas aeruginosa]AYQ81919.1 hypothetical protein D8667_10220 [Pseudomonas aeruginosa]AYR13793.1 hypothetical protein D8668_18435 [Pseudomonas aeruginosa]AZN05589.1 hypothetical protein EJA98_09250 [Pseudomonas aeruginosa]AZN12610.1 hypothetical protein EJA97_04830 [Pseudomonas aeruginosa]
MDVLTSHSSPLIIASVQGVACNGTVGMTLCPGKQQPNALSGAFQRDLSLDLDRVQSWGAAAVVTLMSQDELSALKVAQLGDEVENRGMLWFQLPVANHHLPDADFERQWVYAGVRLRGLLRAGKKVLVHCGSGLGRTGVIAARLLVELGDSNQQAIAKVREARSGALQESAHVQYLEHCQLASNDAWLDRVLGCLLGGAVGDAFGYAVEFDSLAKIRECFGEQGLTRPVFQDGKLVVSDDTQMTLFTLEGILRSTDVNGEPTSSVLLDEVRHAYLDWYDTQLGKQSASSVLHGRLAARPALRVKRAPGNTCLSALKSGGQGSIERRINQSKGCGGVMRTAPLGFLQDVDWFDLGARVAALTHGHVEGWAPAGILPRIVARLIKGEEKFLAVRNGFSDACEWGHVYGESAGTERYLLARKLARKMRFNAHEAIRQLGQGWVGDEALAIAMYAFLSARSYTDAIGRATNHDGDSDSTASIAGQLWGAQHGVSDIPHAWIRRLDVLDEVLLLVQQMQSWRRLVGSDSYGQPTVSAEIEPCIRLIEMTHELHTLGYQQIRIFPYMAPSGCSWRVEWAPASAFRSSVEPPSVESERELVRYSSGSGWKPFEWQGVQELTALNMAQQFVRQFPELARSGQGDDWCYAGWLARLLGEVRRGRLPYMLADWPIDLARGVPMTSGDPFPLPPTLGREPEFGHNPEDDLADEELLSEGLFEQAESPVDHVDDEPTPDQFDFTDLYGRTHGLVAFYHQGAPYLLQVTQLIWQQLPAPREESSSQLCLLAGWPGEGKLGVHNLLENYLKVADQACEMAAEATDQDWKSESGVLDWSKVEHTFAEMDKALLATAFQLSQLIEHIAQAAG